MSSNWRRHQKGQSKASFGSILTVGRYILGYPSNGMLWYICLKQWMVCSGSVQNAGFGGIDFILLAANHYITISWWFKHTNSLLLMIIQPRYQKRVVSMNLLYIVHLYIHRFSLNRHPDFCSFSCTMISMSFGPSSEMPRQPQWEVRETWRAFGLSWWSPLLGEPMMFSKKWGFSQNFTSNTWHLDAIKAITSKQHMVDINCMEDP